jgi:hypothetical protein
MILHISSTCSYPSHNKWQSRFDSHLIHRDDHDQRCDPFICPSFLSFFPVSHNNIIIGRSTTRTILNILYQMIQLILGGLLIHIRAIIRLIRFPLIDYWCCPSFQPDFRYRGSPSQNLWFQLGLQLPALSLYRFRQIQSECSRWWWVPIISISFQSMYKIIDFILEFFLWPLLLIQGK